MSTIRPGTEVRRADGTRGVVTEADRKGGYVGVMFIGGNYVVLSHVDELQPIETA